MDDQTQGGQMGGSQMPPQPPTGGQNSGMFDPQMGQPPMGGGQMGGMPGDPMGDMGMGSDPAANQPPAAPSKPANFQLGALLPPVLKIKVPAHELQFDEQYFLHLLAGSISLTKDEKIRIVESIPKLKQAQIDELIKIFEEERTKFAELGEEHVPQLDKLARQHYEDWVDIEMHQQQASKAEQDAAQAEEIRKQLGL